MEEQPVPVKIIIYIFPVKPVKAEPVLRVAKHRRLAWLLILTGRNMRFRLIENDFLVNRNIPDSLFKAVGPLHFDRIYPGNFPQSHVLPAFNTGFKSPFW